MELPIPPLELTVPINELTDPIIELIYPLLIDPCDSHVHIQEQQEQLSQAGTSKR